VVVVCPKCKIKLKVDEKRLVPQGTRFKCPKCSAALLVKRPIAQVKKSLDGNKILIAHSNPSVVQTAQKLLADQGYTVLTAADGIDAMVKSLKELPLFGIIEVALPKIYGFEVCKQLKTRPETKDMKFILVPSIYDKTKYRREPVSLYGADDYIEEHDLSTRLLESLDKIRKTAETGPEEVRTGPPATAARAPEPAGAAKAAEGPSVAAFGLAEDKTVDEAVERARRLARTIINDIYLYNSAKVDEAVRRGNFYTVFASEVREGKKLFDNRIPPETRSKADFYKEAFDNFLATKKKAL
jgi:CheY-like chemotaxis protein